MGASEAILGLSSGEGWSGLVVVPAQAGPLQGLGAPISVSDVIPRAPGAVPAGRVEVFDAAGRKAVTAPGPAPASSSAGGQGRRDADAATRRTKAGRGGSEERAAQPPAPKAPEKKTDTRSRVASKSRREPEPKGRDAEKPTRVRRLRARR
jgi:hypothetical protein